MPWTMIAVSIGAQLFNSWQTNKKNEELQTRQKEFQKAAQQKEFDRMRQLQREAAKLALEIEAEVHEQRLEDIQKNYDDAVKNLATEIAIKKWPLKVLPFVMRGESFGTFFNGSKSILMHTIFTPSNCESFNNAVYADIDLQLEAECNEHWNVQSSHPIAYYGGAWRKSKLDLDQIDLLRTQLKNVPTVVISPYFAPELYFRVKIWGMGKDTEVKIELPQGIFSYEYTKGMNYSPNNETPQGDLKATTIEEFVPYLECLIGYIADVYYWMMYKQIPILPKMIVNNINNVDKYLKEELATLYDAELKRSIDGIKDATLKYSDFCFYLEGISTILPKEQIKKYKNSVAIYSQLPPIDKKQNESLNFDEVQLNKCDILDLIERYKKYVGENVQTLNFDTSLVIANTAYRTLSVYIIDEKTNHYLDLPKSFAYKIYFNQMARDKNVRLIFNQYAKNNVVIINKYNIDKIITILKTLIY